MARIVWGLILLAAVLLPGQVRALDSYEQGHAKCEAWSAAELARWGASGRHNCAFAAGPDHGFSTGTYWWYAYRPSSPSSISIAFQVSGPLDCGAKPSYSASYGSDISVCKGGCIYAPQPGGSLDTVRSGSWLAQLQTSTYAPTGQTCALDSPPPPPPRKLCGGGSCCDSAANTCCALNSVGAQVCVPWRKPPGAPGGCVSDGDTTLCAGSPPPLPPNPPVADPPTEIADTDIYGHQDSPGSPITLTTINNYNTGAGGQSNNGGTPDDVGDVPDGADPKPGSGNDPASASSTGKTGDGTRASGGTNCTTPPICEGSAATCMVVTQTYLLRCPPGGQGDGSGDGDGDSTVPGLDGIGEAPGEGFLRDETVLDKLDEGGLGGGGQCPTLLTLDLDDYGVHFDSTDLPWCEILDKAGYILMLVAAFVSLKILSGGTK